MFVGSVDNGNVVLESNKEVVASIRREEDCEFVEADKFRFELVTGLVTIFSLDIRED
jgi:hypothetical protein